MPPVTGARMPARRKFLLAAGMVPIFLLGYFLTLGRGLSSTPSDDAWTLLDLSLEQFNARNFPEAVSAAQGAVRLDPNLPMAYYFMAAAYRATGQQDQAMQAATAALRIAPDFGPAKEIIAEIQSQETIEEATAEPKSAEDWVKRSIVYFRQLKFPECIAAARTAIKLDPKSASAHNNVSACAFGLRDFDLAIAEAEAALRIQPAFGLAKGNLAAAQASKARALGKQAK